MILRKGSSLLTTVLTVAAVTAVGGAGVMALTGNSLCSMVGGDCGVAACGDNATDGEVVLASNTDASSGAEASSCCPLGDLAKGDSSATVTPAATAAKSSCSDKADCGSSCGEGVAVMAASNAAKSSCGDKADCGSSCGGDVVMAASNAAKASCSDTADCGSSCGGDVVMAASMSAKEACGPCPVMTFNTHVAGFAAMLASNTTAESSCCGSCADPCGSHDAAQLADASPVAGHMVSTSGIVVPAMFFSTQKIDHDSLTAAGCCRSTAMNVSAVSECGEAKDCCSKGAAQVINASNADAASCCGSSCSEKADCSDKADCGDACDEAKCAKTVAAAQ